MADEDLRQLQRDAAGGDPAAEARLLVQRLRAGNVDRARVELAAGLGHDPAARAVGEAPNLDSTAAYRILARLGEEAWVRGVVALLREPPRPDDPQDRQVQDLVDRALAWAECPCDDHRREAALGPRRGWSQRTVSEVSRARLWTILSALKVIAGGGGVFRSAVLCSGLTPAEAQALQVEFAAAGCLTRPVPDEDLPERDRRPPRERRHLCETLGGEALVVQACGPRRIDVIAAIRRATGLSLQVVRSHLERAGSLIPTGLSLPEAQRLVTSLTDTGATVSLLGREDGLDDAGGPGGGQSLVLDCIGHKKIPAIKEIRRVTGLGLREAKDIADAVGSVVPGVANTEEWPLVRARLATLVPWLLG